MRPLKVALVHDDLVQWGGAERVLLGISEIFPDAPIYTSLFDSSNRLINENFKKKDIRTSFLQRIPFWKKLYKAFLPLYPIAFEQFDFSEYDLVISQTTRFAKVIITKPNTKHICYCHTPPRFLWNFSNEKYPHILDSLFSKLRILDQITANRVDFWLAGSKNAKSRIEKIYKAHSLVLEPFTEDKDKSIQPPGDYYLIISRLNRYKRIDIAVNLFNKSGKKLIIIGKGPEEGGLKRSAKNNIKFYKSLSDSELDYFISNCKALIILAEEDFGLTSLEAQAYGKPVIAYGKGGSLETVIDGKTGYLFKDQSEDSLFEAITKCEKVKINAAECIINSKRFGFEVFREKLLSFVYNC